MRHFTFGRNNGLRVSALALGAGTFGTRWGYGAAPEDVPRIFDKFADAGGTFIDTAASYQVGEAEEILGRLLDGRRDALHRGDEVRHRRARRHRGAADRQRPPRDVPVRRRQPASARHRLHRPAVGALSRFRDPARRDRARARRSRAGRQDPVCRAVELPGMDDGTRRDARRDAGGDTGLGCPVRVQPRRTQRRPGEPADGRVTRPRGGLVVAARRRPAERKVPVEFGRQAHRLESARAHRRRTGQGGDRRRGACRRRRARRSRSAGRGGLASRTRQAVHDGRWCR